MDAPPAYDSGQYYPMKETNSYQSSSYQPSAPLPSSPPPSFTPVFTLAFPPCHLCPKLAIFFCYRCSQPMCLTHKDHYWVPKNPGDFQTEEHVQGARPDPFKDVVVCSTCRPIVHAECNKPGFFTKLFSSSYLKCRTCHLEYERGESPCCPRCFVPVRGQVDPSRPPPALDSCQMNCATVAVDKCYNCNRLICIAHKHHFMSDFAWGKEKLSRDLTLCDGCLLTHYKGREALREGDCRCCGEPGAGAFASCRRCGREKKMLIENKGQFNICYRCPSIARDKCYRCFKFLCPTEKRTHTEKYLSYRGGKRGNHHTQDIHRERIRVVCEDCLDYRRLVEELKNMSMDGKECCYCCVGCILCPIGCIGLPCIITATSLQHTRQIAAFRLKRPHDPLPLAFKNSCECCIFPCEQQFVTPQAELMFEYPIK